MFSNFWPNLSGPGRQPNKSFLARIFLETRLKSASFEHLIGFPAYLEPKFWLRNPILDKNKNVAQKATWPFQTKLLPVITRQQIELESCSNPLKTRKVLCFEFNRIVSFGFGFFVGDVMIGVCFAVILMT